MAPRASSLFAALAASALVLASVSGCGPSLRRVHRGNVYFERCYAADLDVLVPEAERRACWQAWRAQYVLGASAERMDHATERLAMLDPAQAEAIALATGSDPLVPAGEPADSALVLIVSGPPPPDSMTADLAPTSEVVVEPVLEDDPDSQLVDDTQTHVQIVEAAERERAAERRSHRAILAPRSTTPHCARTCQPIWERCSANCTADERGCVLACRRELSICSRSCY